MSTKARVILEAETRDHLTRLARTGTTHARTIQHARTLLLCDEGPGGDAWSDEHVAAALHVSADTVARTRNRYRTPIEALS